MERGNRLKLGLIRRFGQRTKRRFSKLRMLTWRVLHPRVGCCLAKSAIKYGRLYVRLHAGSRIWIGERVVLNALNKRNSLESRGPVIIRTLTKDAEIQIGADTGISSSTISAARGIYIGTRVLVGAGVMITDSDHHVVHASGQSRRYLGLPDSSDSHAIRIGDDVFIGARAIILKGVSVGTGAVIGAGSVVVSDVSPFTIVGGNPARFLGTTR